MVSASNYCSLGLVVILDFELLSVLLEIKFDGKYLKMLVFSCKPKIQFFIFQVLKIFLDTAEAEVRSLISLYSEVVSLNFCLVIR